jgi:hypothetical protein
MNRWAVAVVALMSCAVCMAQDALVFEDFDSVEAWPGFELSRDQAHSGETSALWRDMTERKSVHSSDIPHDWSDYSAFTFWVYNEKKLDAAFMLIIASENPATEGPDYWGVKVRLDFEGWKMFGRTLTPGGGARSPLGWDQIQSMNFTASGWDNTPNPEAVVYVDELKLTNEYGGPGPLISDADFYGLLREDIEALAPTREAAAAEDYDLAGERLLEYMPAREWPTHKFDWREWDKKRDPKYNTAKADYILTHMFSSFHREADLGPDIDWTTNGFDPAEPAYTPEWTYNLNRFGNWVTLGRAYWATGDEKYAQEFVAQMLDWTHDQPPPDLGSPNTAPCWRTIEQGIRTAGSWMDAYYYFLGSPSMTPHAHTTFLKSFVEHGRTLTRMTVDYPGHGGNWVTMECNGLAHIGVMFPEFSEAEHWRQVAYDRLLMELDRQVYADGAQHELSTSYHQVSRGNFLRALAPAQRNDVEVPAEYLDKLKRMYWYNLYAMKPDLRLPPLNDSGDSGVASSLKEAYEIWGDEEFLWGATGGEQGEPLDFTSYFFPWAGWAIMRSGWERTDRYLMFEVGPFGTGHQHEDKLGLYLYGYGRALLTEAGVYTYDRSKWRRYALATPSHNTIMVDGNGQHRRGLRETYRANEPMTDCWATTEVFDWARGVYDKGYGPLIAEDGKSLGREHDITDVQHERTVIFVRPDYYIVIDRLLGDGGEAHTYSNLFHFDADEATADDQTLVVSSADAGRANLTLVPLATDGLTLRMVKGQENPVQGWIPRENHRAIPTAIYEKTGPTPELFVTLMMPHPTEEVPEFTAELIADTSEMVAISVRTDGGEDIILYSFDGPMAMEAGGVAANAQLVVVRRPAEGAAVAGLLGGTEVSVEGQVVAPVAPDNPGG